MKQARLYHEAISGILRDLGKLKEEFSHFSKVFESIALLLRDDRLQDIQTEFRLNLFNIKITSIPLTNKTSDSRR